MTITKERSSATQRLYLAPRHYKLPKNMGACLHENADANCPKIQDLDFLTWLLSMPPQVILSPPTSFRRVRFSRVTVISWGVINRDKPTLHYVDLLWICIHNKSITNRRNGVWAINSVSEQGCGSGAVNSAYIVRALNVKKFKKKTATDQFKRWVEILYNTCTYTYFKMRKLPIIKIYM